MNVTIMLYLAGISSNISNFLWLLMTIGFAVILFGCIIKEEVIPHIKKLVVIAGVIGLLAALIPDKNTVYLMAAAEVGKDVASNPKVSTTMDKLFKVIDSKLDEQLVGKSKGGK